MTPCVCVSLIQMCRYRPEALTAAADEDLLKQFRLRLQFLGRYNQLASKRASADSAPTAATGPGGKRKAAAVDRAMALSGEARERLVLAKLTGNLQLLIREFFKPAPTFKGAITPSWSPSIDVAPPATVATVTASSQAKKPALDNAHKAGRPRGGRGNAFGGRPRR